MFDYDRIISGITKARERGIRLTTDDWGDIESGAACALTACKIGETGTGWLDPVVHDPEYQAADYFGVPVREVTAFVAAFDSNTPVEYSRCSHASACSNSYKAGLRIREWAELPEDEDESEYDDDA